MLCAQSELGDVVYVELPEVGSTVEAGKQFGVVESVKVSSAFKNSLDLATDSPNLLPGMVDKHCPGKQAVRCRSTDRKSALADKP